MPRNDSPLARIGFEKHELENRTNALTKDALVKNAYYEDETRSMVKRPGIAVETSYAGTCGSGIYNFDGSLLTVVDGTIRNISTAAPSAWEFFTIEPIVNEAAIRDPGFVGLSDGRIFLVGGHSPDTNRASIYDATTDAWTQVTDYPGTVTSTEGVIGAACLTQDTILVINSSDSGGSPCYIYTISTNSWASAANHPLNFEGAASTNGQGQVVGLNFSGKAVTVGGYVISAVTGCYIYDIATDAWTFIVALSSAHSRHACAALLDSTILITGHQAGIGDSTDEALILDPYTGNITTVAVMPEVRFWHTAQTLQSGKVFVGGGRRRISGTQSDPTSSYVYDPVGDTWTAFPNIPNFASSYCVGAIGEVGRVYIVQNIATASFIRAGATTPAISVLEPDTEDNPGTLCEQVDFAELQIGESSTLFIKTANDAWTLNEGVVTQVTDADYPAKTVPGVVSLDGYIFVMTPKAEIYNSDLETPTAWNALNFINAEMEPDPGIAIAKHLNYVVAFGDWSTEFFYDAANATGSPLSRLDSSSLWIGCAAARSAVNIGNNLLWVAKDRTKGRFVMALEGLTAMRVSTAPVDRILTASTLETVRAYPVMLDGHLFYILNLLDDDMTLVLDIGTKKWAVWTSLTAAASKSVTLARSGETATGTSASHGYAEGDIVTIAGADQTDYNGDYVIHNVTTNTFDFTVRNSPTTPATGTITVNTYTEAEFIGTYSVHKGGTNYVQDPLTGDVYSFSSTAYRDDSVPIKVDLRTREHDFDTLINKFIAYLEVHADREDSFLSYRFSDDDYQTYSKFRDKWLNGRAKFDRTGSTRRRAHEIVHVGNTAFRVQYLEAYVEIGEH